ncbi:MAG: hypothetical protein ACJA0H_000299 [Francisellaceae bacterium]|jgi:hypothetical protein
MKRGYMKLKADAKKRLMFIQAEDYNYLCYNLLIILDYYKCYSEDKPFKDFRKIAYLVDFISNNKKISLYDANDLTEVYSHAQLKKKLISHLLIILKNMGFVEISINTTHRTFNVWLNQSKELNSFIKNEMFFDEYERVELLNKQVPSIRTATIKTMVEKIFSNKGVITWEI